MRSRETGAIELVRARVNDGEIDLDGVIEGLDSLFATSAFDLAYKAGEFLIARLYGGDLAQFRMSGRRHLDYRRLLAHPRLRLSPTAIWRSLRVYELCERFPWLNECPELRVTHIYAVLGLPESTQERLLRDAASQGWDPNAVERAAKPLRVAGGRGRPRTPPVDMSIRYLKRFLECSTSTEFELHPNSDAVGELRELVSAVRSRLRALEDALRDPIGEKISAAG